MTYSSFVRLIFLPLALHTDTFSLSRHSTNRGTVANVRLIYKMYRYIVLIEHINKLHATCIHGVYNSNSIIVGMLSQEWMSIHVIMETSDYNHTSTTPLHHLQLNLNFCASWLISVTYYNIFFKRIHSKFLTSSLCCNTITLVSILNGSAGKWLQRQTVNGLLQKERKLHTTIIQGDTRNTLIIRKYLHRLQVPRFAGYGANSVSNSIRSSPPPNESSEDSSCKKLTKPAIHEKKSKKSNIKNLLIVIKFTCRMHDIVWRNWWSELVSLS